MLRRLSDALTGGNAGQWEEVCHAAEQSAEERDRLREALQTLVASAHPNEQEQPTMAAAWQKAVSALTAVRP